MDGSVKVNVSGSAGISVGSSGGSNVSKSVVTIVDIAVQWMTVRTSVCSSVGSSGSLCR